MAKNKLTKRNIIEQMQFRDQSRPDPGIPANLANRETSFSHVDFPNAPEGYSNYEEFLASQEYKKSLIRLEKLTGKKNIGVGTRGEYMRMNSAARQLIGEIYRIENEHREELQQLCERVVREYFKIPQNALQFALVLNPPEKVRVPQKPRPNQDMELAQELSNDVMFERAKRRLINSIIQGSSINGTWLFRKVQNELIQITGDQEIIDKYSFFASTMLLGYWQFSDQLIGSSQGEGEEAAGKTRVDKTTKPPTIHAEGLSFPFLLHETIKGVMEFLQRQVKKGADELEDYLTAKKMEDTIEKETWDIRLGPEIVRRVIKQLPKSVRTNENERKISFYMLTNIANLPARDYVIVMKEVIGNTPNGKKLLGAMYYDLTRQLDKEQMAKSETEFTRVLNSVKETVSNDQLRDFFGSMGISLPGNEGDDEE